MSSLVKKFSSWLCQKLVQPKILIFELGLQLPCALLFTALHQRTYGRRFNTPSLPPLEPRTRLPVSGRISPKATGS